MGGDDRAMKKAKTRQRSRRIVNRRRLHMELQARLQRTSPRATRIIADTLERIGAFLAKRSAMHARDAGRITIKESDARRARDAFLAPRQTMTETAAKLRTWVADLEAEARTSGGNLGLDDEEEV